MGVGAIVVGAVLTWAVWESGWIVWLTFMPIVAGMAMIVGGLSDVAQAARGRTPFKRAHREASKTPAAVEDVVEIRGASAAVLPAPLPDDGAAFPRMRDLLYTGHRLEEGDITRFERRRALRLPGQYKRFLLRFNGGELTPSWFAYQAGGVARGGHVKRFFSLGTGGAEDLDRICDHHGGPGADLPGGMLPVAEAGEGFFICLCLSGPEAGGVYVSEPTAGVALPAAAPMHRVSRDFFGFLSSLTWEPGTAPPPAPKRRRRG